MLNRNLKKSEIALILVLVAALLGLLYYQFVYKEQQASISRYDTAELENQIMIEQARAAQIRSMQDEIELNQSDESTVTGVVESYNNLKAEIRELNNIFGDAEAFNFGFDQAVATGDAVRRKISANFTAKDYATAKQMLTKLHNSQYRCLIRDINISTTTSSRYYNNQTNSYYNLEPNLNRGPVAVSFTVTFYETLYNATTTDGLLIENSGNSSSSDPSLAEQMYNKTAEYNELGLN